MTTPARRILSGIQPTGRLHIGNYFGALKQWVASQRQEGERFFCIVDLHALTVPGDPDALRESTLYTAAAYIACGIDPKSSTLFRQSRVPEHTRLQWVLGCATPLGWLNRMTQYKEKSAADKAANCLGIYSYPVLMAADILLYGATDVPVGDDQKQHIELARDLALAFNARYDADIFTVPEPVIRSEAARVMSLRDGRAKMSKSAISDQSRINLTDSDSDIRHKIMKAKTDSFPGVTYAPDERPEVANLLRILAAGLGEKTESVAAKYAGANSAVLIKKDLADALIAEISPIRDELLRLYHNDRAALTSILEEGENRAREIAGEVMGRVDHAVGLA
ncbi:MAG: tryptophan--tRNA ligase [Rickettsiales bacterium]